MIGFRSGMKVRPRRISRVDAAGTRGALDHTTLNQVTRHRCSITRVAARGADVLAITAASTGVPLTPVSWDLGGIDGDAEAKAVGAAKRMYEARVVLQHEGH